MALKKLLNKGTVYKRNDNRWGGAVRYRDEQGVTRRKSFCSTTKKAVLQKINDYIERFNKEVAEADEANKPLRKSMQKWLEIFQYGTVRKATYDRKEDSAKYYIYPRIGDLIISDMKCGKSRRSIKINVMRIGNSIKATEVYNEKNSCLRRFQHLGF